VPDYPALPQPTEGNPTLAIRKLRETLEILLRRQSTVDKSAVTVQDLLDLGLIKDADLKKLRPVR
jgi:hypothetical protein